MSRIAALVAIVDRLYSPGGCPWDQAQTWRSMRPYLLEECHEVLDAIQGGDPAAVRGELGDLLFVVALLARMAEDLPPEQAFNLESVADGIAAKMVHRHPHVFAGAQRPGGPEAGIVAWEAIKAAESPPDGPPRSRMAGVPRSLPALLRCHRQSEKAASVGFDWPDAAGVLGKIREELGELEEAMAGPDPDAVAHEYGDLLMAVGSLGRHVGCPPESTLGQANDRFADRFRIMEQLAWQAGQSLRDLDADALDALWEAAKAHTAPFPAASGD